MPSVHRVELGDHLSNIAEKHEFENFETLWNLPENKDLRDHREDPHELLPDDEVVVPDKKTRVFEAQTAMHHQYVVHLHQLDLRLRVLDLFGKAVANSSCILDVDGTQTELTTDGDGIIVLSSIPRSAKKARLTVEELEFDLSIGELTPLPEYSGVQRRLNNLGYYAGDLAESDEEAFDFDILSFAVELFQRDNGLPADGVASPETVDKLAEVYGT